MYRQVDNKIYRLFDIKKTQIEMVRDRGYDIPEDEEILLTSDVNYFVNHIKQLGLKTRGTSNSLLSRSYMSEADGETKARSILVYYANKVSQQQKQISADIVREFINLVQKYATTEAVLIVDAPLSSTGNEELKSLTLTKWQVFFESDLTYNLTAHVDTNRHTLIPPEDADRILHQLKADRSKLIVIKIDKPIVRYYGWSIGDLIRVERDDQCINILSSKSINYRVVVG